MDLKQIGFVTNLIRKAIREKDICGAKEAAGIFVVCVDVLPPGTLLKLLTLRPAPPKPPVSP
jgi:hypothetical protein